VGSDQQIRKGFIACGNTQDIDEDDECVILLLSTCSYDTGILGDKSLMASDQQRVAKVVRVYMVQDMVHFP